MRQCLRKSGPGAGGGRAQPDCPTLLSLWSLSTVFKAGPGSQVPASVDPSKPLIPQVSWGGRGVPKPGVFPRNGCLLPLQCLP